QRVRCRPCVSAAADTIEPSLTVAAPFSSALGQHFTLSQLRLSERRQLGSVDAGDAPSPQPHARGSAFTFLKTAAKTPPARPRLHPLWWPAGPCPHRGV